MEQEVPVTIHSGKPKEPDSTPHDTRIPKQVSELGDRISDAFSCFRNSESCDILMQGVEKTKHYIRKNPAQAMLLSLGAGMLFGFLIKRKH